MALELTRDQAELIARTFFGEPNKALSSRNELRFGRNGSKSVDLQKGTYYDHEAKEGGDMFQLVKNGNGCSDRETFEWFEKEGFKPQPASRHQDQSGYRREPNGEADDIPYDADNDPFKNIILKNNRKRSTSQFRIVKAWSYVDEAGAEFFQVCRLENGELGADGKPVKTYRQRHKVKWRVY
jgi:hypothetical protein